MNKNSKLEPFFKCLGGKRQLLSELHERLPKDFFTNKYTYIEPFVGGGALALSILQKNPKQKIILNDYNLHISNLWKTVRYNPEKLISEYNELVIKPYEKETFLEIRDLINSTKGLTESIIAYSPNIAAQFLYLNKNCFNGLIRYNKNGEFNSPFGSYKKVQTYNKDLILNVSKCLKNIPIYSLDFQQLIIETKITSKKNCLFYFDPPYAPLSKTSNFTSYTKQGFSTYDQFRLKSTIEFLDLLGIKFILSNSDSDLVNKLYSAYNVHKVRASRSINSKGSKRGKITEYIITNY